MRKVNPDLMGAPCDELDQVKRGSVRALKRPETRPGGLAVRRDEPFDSRGAFFDGGGDQAVGKRGNPVGDRQVQPVDCSVLQLQRKLLLGPGTFCDQK